MPENFPGFVCPATRAPLREATHAELDTLNRALAQRTEPPHLPEGTPLALPLVTALANAEGSDFYPVHDGIPVLIPEMRMGADGAPVAAE